LEHGLACLYLFAAHSLKNDASEGGLTDEQAKMVRNWKRRLAHVAVEEMLHLAQVSNLLTAIGASPRFERSNFPMPSSAFPFGLRLTLEPFSKETIERFVCYEMPEAGVLSPQQEEVYEPVRARVIAAESAGTQPLGGGERPSGSMRSTPERALKSLKSTLRPLVSSITRLKPVSMPYPKAISSSGPRRHRRTRDSLTCKGSWSQSLTAPPPAPESRW
jgi:hypothetical protein